jgi:poly(hydroxyalkanoate) depolymerase family esterase
MNPLFQRLLDDAARQTRTGNLRGATAAIKAALGRMAARPPMPPTPTMTPAQRSNAPGAATQPGRFIDGKHADAAGSRDYKLYIPPQYKGQALPLVVMLHGCTQDPDDFARGTGMNDAARAQGFFVLYPAQTQNANMQRCWNWFKHNHQQRGRGEPALLAGMTRAVMAQYGIDPQRVHVAGLSAGGAMAAILGDTYPDVFAAVGVHSGLATGAASDVGSALAAMQGAGGVRTNTGLSGLPGLRSRAPAAERPQAPRAAAAPATIVFHGDADHTVHPGNGDEVAAACMASSEGGAGWSAQAAPPERGRSDNGLEYTRRLHRDAAGRVRCEHWLVHGAGHAWSGGRADGSYTDPHGPDATREMLRFFFANPARPVH